MPHRLLGLSFQHFLDEHQLTVLGSDLRFRAPKSLAKQNDAIADVSEDGFGQSCVQFSEDDPEVQLLADILPGTC